MKTANEEFLDALEELWPLIRNSESQNMGTFLASCINTEADDETLQKITEVMRQHIEGLRSGEIR